MDTPRAIEGQSGPQVDFLERPEDVVIFGGAAFGGKTFSLLLDPLRYVSDPKFAAVIFRRTTPQITNEGGLWDSSLEIYPLLGAVGSYHRLEWKFPSGASIRFAHMEHEKNRFDWQGAQIPYIAFEEATQFHEKQFWYLFGRNRSGAGTFPPQFRMTCNPDPDAFVAKFVAWWIDQETGYAIKARSGRTRFFSRREDELITASTRQEVIDQCGVDCEPKSYTFIPSSIEDNKIGLAKNPGYLANLKALPKIDREQLLKGNWLIRPGAGMFFRPEYFRIVEAGPADVVARVRFWDRAATEKRTGNDPDSTYSVRVSKTRQGIYTIEHGLRMFATPHTVEQAIVNMASSDPEGTAVCFNQDPGSAGVSEAQAMARELEGFNVRFWPASGDKAVRCKPASAQAEAGNVQMVRGNWNADYLLELENFPDGRYDDGVDCLSGCFEYFSRAREVVLL